MIDSAGPARILVAAAVQRESRRDPPDAGGERRSGRRARDAG